MHPEVAELANASWQYSSETNSLPPGINPIAVNKYYYYYYY
jgi:hypothetical protein